MDTWYISDLQHPDDIRLDYWVGFTTSVDRFKELECRYYMEILNLLAVF